ncbi:MAG: sigma-70 family RNA polymerase sigma factor [Candidatus Poribacteria bacterium]|nr:sigma-70 family RNA polymerase sigma factor [Candidatus Poribacteria bacterium]
MQQRFGNPRQRGKCPFKIEPNEPLSAETSIDQCSTCVCRNNTYLLSHKEDLRQIAFLTILEETPNYDPAHPSGASFITFMKAKVCIRLWREQRKLLQEVPCSHEECCQTDEENKKNPLEAVLVTHACAIENIADSAIQQIEGEFLRKHLPKLLEKLTEKERRVIEMKFFEEQRGVQIAQELGISEGRVSQLTQSAFAKLGKAYIALLNAEQGNPYREI